MKLWMIALAVAGVATAVVVGCSDDHDDDHPDAGAHTSVFPACNEITQACHEVDVEEGPIHNCHETAHAAKSEADCTGVKANCLKICGEAAADAGAAHDGGNEADGH